MALKILFLSHQFYPYIGGIEVNSEILATAFYKAGHQVVLLTWTEATGDKKFPFTIIRKPTVKALLKQHQWADIVYENNPCLRLAWPKIFFGKAHVVALRTWISRIDGKIGVQDLVKKAWLRTASAVIAVSDSVRQKSWPAAIVIGNPYRVELFKIHQQATRDKCFVFLGRLVSDKGADMAIRALHTLLQQKENINNTSLSLTIIGDGEAFASLQALVKSLNLSESVSFTGPLTGESLVDCLNRHRYMLVPSIWQEPFGNVALEGMACGCIPIVSDGGGLPDAVGNAGVVFRRGNEVDFVQSLLKLLQDTSYEQALRKAAEPHLAAHHPEVVSRRYLSVIEQVMVKV